jgi:hypothetical protein
MSLIPPDESRGDCRTTPNTPNSDRRTVDRFRAVAASLVATLAAAIERLVTGYSRQGVDRTEGSSTALPDTVDEGGLARYERPPDRAVGTELELVCTETDEQLTVEAADNPDAVISSDTWVPIER